MGDNNRTAENSSHGTVPKAPQEPVRDDTPLVGKGVQLLGGQEAPENLGTMGAGDSMEVDVPSGGEESGGEDEIAAEIERLKKEQKKVQMRTKLRCLREHKA